ncbi:MULTISPECIES: hypothetical protein [unclassified Nocardia]|uniref:hypothetical protein n=1 Tax=unclassified Nocardia TaxID=2637762 RepID=UPI001CE3C8FE|nr:MULTISPECIES: hypothetical protein [unclassified Nocardia]
MITFLLSLAVIVGFAVIIAHYTARFGSTDIVDRDAQRRDHDLTVLLGRTSHR